MSAVCPCRTAAPADAGAAAYIEEVERRADAGQRLAERMREIDHGHVRTLAHYQAMVAEARAEK